MIFTVWKTRKPAGENQAELVAQTSDKSRAFDLAYKGNRSELKHRNSGNGTVNGNREITEVFTKDELKSAGFGGQIPD